MTQKNRVISLGSEWREWPAEFWGTKDWEMARATNQPMGQTLPTPPPYRSLPAGFTLFPERKSKRAAAADRALQKLGLR
jgi:hypothetical protein